MPPTSSDEPRLLIKVSRAAQMLDVSRAHLYNMINHGSVPTVRLAGSVRIPAEALRNLALRGTEDQQ